MPLDPRLEEMNKQYKANTGRNIKKKDMELLGTGLFLSDMMVIAESLMAALKPKKVDEDADK